MNDYGRLSTVRDMIPNLGSLSYAKGLAQASESVIADVWGIFKMYSE